MTVENAQKIISKFGGACKLATILDVWPASVYRWTYPKDRNGTGGMIPSEHMNTMLAYAQKNGIDLKPDDFFK